MGNRVENLEISSEEIHVWYVSLHEAEERVDDLARLLSQAERERADRFRSLADRRRFIISRGLLRSLLAEYVGERAQNLLFRYGTYGKPFLPNNINNRNIHFNVSHSKKYILYAITRSREVGVDLEYVNPAFDFVSVVERYYSAAERLAFFALPEEKRTRAFFKSWTCKEAFIKAMGEGLLRTLPTFEVTLDPDQPSRLMRISGIPHEGCWTLRDLHPPRNYFATLCARGEDFRVIERELQVSTKGLRERRCQEVKI